MFKAATIIGNWCENSNFESAEGAAKNITQMLTNAADTAMPRVKGNSYKKKKAFWWTPEINEARRDYM